MTLTVMSRSAVESWRLSPWKRSKYIMFMVYGDSMIGDWKSLFNTSINSTSMPSALPPQFLFLSTCPKVRANPILSSLWISSLTSGRDSEWYLISANGGIVEFYRQMKYFDVVRMQTQIWCKLSALSSSCLPFPNAFPMPLINAPKFSGKASLP